MNSPAPPVVAGWFDNMMAPVIKACRFDGEPPAVELRSHMQLAGQSRRADAGQRVLLAGRATLWGRFSLASTYLHEVAHVLCNRLPNWLTVESHGPVFCLVLSCLYGRAATVPHLAALPSSISFYDFAECPAELDGVADWQAEVVRFLIAETRNLANSSCSAEMLAKDADEAWRNFTAGRIDVTRTREAERLRKQALDRRLSELRLHLRASYKSNYFLATGAIFGWCFAIFNGAACQMK